MSKQHAPTGAMGILCFGILGSASVFAQPPEGPAPTFGAALQAAGWNVEVLVDGSLQLTPGAASVEMTDGTDATAVPGSHPDAEPGRVAETAGWQALRRFGWRVDTDADGATLLFPPSPAPLQRSDVPSEPPPTPRARQDQSDAPQASRDARDALAQDLNVLLAERGWRSERDADGALLLYPLLPVDTDTPTTTPDAGFFPAAVTEGQIQLPVDRWREAHIVATSWLDALGDDTLQLGRLRRVFRVYVVSIVERGHPFALRHQISVGVDDGRVIVLN